VVRGEVRGEEALLSPGKIGLWARFFANDNPVYALNNRLGALAAVHRLPAEGEIRVLEVGAGAGSGSQAMVEALAAAGHLDRLATYRLTEPAGMLRRRAVRAVAGRWPQLPLAEGALDMDRPWSDPSGAAGQGVEPGSFDLVFAVNVFHVAVDLGAALRRAREALAPGGVLVLGECLRPFPGQPVAAEMTFLPLESFREVHTDPELRPHPGFLTPELWVANLERAGFEEVEIVPDVRRLREVYPRVAAGAVCGRRPGAAGGDR
jgi:SAM-dependent methyltransferase